MAFSASEGKEFFRDWLVHFAKPQGFKTFLDIGCGAGLYGKIIRQVYSKGGLLLAGVDIFPEYVTRFNLKKIYDIIIIGDIRNFPKEMIPPIDLIITGDVLEHLTKEDAVSVVDKLRSRCRFLWAALPVKIGRPWSVGYSQPESEYAVNPAEKHLHDYYGEEIQECFRPMWLVPFRLTGCFLIEGDIR